MKKVGKLVRVKKFILNKRGCRDAIEVLLQLASPTLLPPYFKYVMVHKIITEGQGATHVTAM